MQKQITDSVILELTFDIGRNGLQMSVQNMNRGTFTIYVYMFGVLRKFENKT